LNIPSIDSLFKFDVLKFVFLSPDTLISGFLWYLGWHSGIAFHEMGHYMEAARQNSLNKESQREAKANWLEAKSLSRVKWAIKIFLQIPWGKFRGIKKYGRGCAANFTYDGPFNLAVAAAGPRMSKKVALFTLPPAVLLIAGGLLRTNELMLYAGRLAFIIGVVTCLDFRLADFGRYEEFRKREARAKEGEQESGKKSKRLAAWLVEAPKKRNFLIQERLQRVGDISAPWQFRNCAMGGRHTEKEYPESNISMQEGMFLPIKARDYEEAQEITLRLQTRLKEIIEKTEGCRVMGIGLEGGIAPYIREDPADRVPELKLWRLMVQAIKDVGLIPGEDVAIVLDPAASELENAYRKESGIADSVGMYKFWRSARKEETIMSNEDLVSFYETAIAEGIPILSIEDPLAEDDHAGYELIMKTLGKDFIFILGDDLIVTKDSVIEECARKKLINTALIKANQIGTLSETLIAMLVARAYGLELVISHRSKSPNDSMEAEIALAANALGLKAGGGANTERLAKYGYVIQQMRKLGKTGRAIASEASRETLDKVRIIRVSGWEEATNAGIPTVGVKVTLGIQAEDEFVAIGAYTGATPVGTSAGSGEAVHLVDSIVFKDEIVVKKHPEFFEKQPDDTYRFRKKLTRQEVAAIKDEELESRYELAQRYEGKGTLNAVSNANRLLAAYDGKKINEIGSVFEIDNMLLRAEVEEATRRGYLQPGATQEDKVASAQRKGMLGMNAILSISLALARAAQVKENKKLYEILREAMKLTALKAVNAHYREVGLDFSWEATIELLKEFRQELEKKGQLLYPYLREAAGIYDFEGNSGRKAPSI